MSNLTNVQKGDALMAFDMASSILQDKSILEAGSRMSGETVHRPLRGNDVEAQIKMDCRGMHTIFTSMAGLMRDLDVPTLAEPMERKAKAISSLIEAGKVRVEHPAVAMGQALVNDFDRALARSELREGVAGTPETRSAHIKEALGGTDPAMLTTEQGQRERAAEADMPYVRRAIVSCTR